MEHQISLNIPDATIVFAKILGTTDKQHQLIVPRRVLEQFPVVRTQYQRDFTAFDENENEWRFVLAVCQVGDYEKPVLCKAEWHEFVLAYNVGDNDGNYGVVCYNPMISMIACKFDL